VAATLASCTVAWAAAGTAPAGENEDPTVPVTELRAGAQPGALVTGRVAANIPIADTMVVSPTVIPLQEAVPGRRYAVTIRVENRRRARTDFDLVPIGVAGSREPGRSVEYLEDTDPAAAATARSWLRPVAARVRLEPREYAEVPVEVAIPADTGPGGHYAAIAVRARATDSGADDTQVGVQSQIAVTLLVEMAGDLERRLQLRRVSAPGVIWSRGPARVSARVRNTGNTFATPSGTAQVRSVFGSVVARFPVNAGRVLLPGGEGAAEATWKRPPWFGRYSIQLRMQASEGGAPVQRQTVTFWALPPWWVFALLGGLVALVVWRILRSTGAHEDDPDQWEDPEEIASGAGEPGSR